MKKQPFLLIGILILIFSCTTEKKETRSKAPEKEVVQKESTIEILDIKKWYDEKDLVGSFALYDLNQDKYYYYNEERCRKRFPPASTFKIPNTLFLLESEIVADENHMIKWDGEPINRKELEKDMNLREAFRISCFPCYRTMTNEMGLEQMQKQLAGINYGKMQVNEENLDIFWLEPPSAISQMEQIDFLQKLYKETLPFSKENMQLVKDFMLLEKKENYSLSGKTGWTIMENDYNVGWLVGYLERNGNVYFFANNIEATQPDRRTFIKARMAITKKVMNELKLLE